MSEATSNTPIAPIDEQVIAAMRRASAMTLPDNPSAAGMKAQAIRRRFWESIFGGRGSLLCELERVIGEVNAALAESGAQLLLKITAHADDADIHVTPEQKQAWDEMLSLAAGVAFTTDETLSLEQGVLSVNTAHQPDPDNTLPITSAAVATTVGNIEILLKTL